MQAARGPVQQAHAERAFQSLQALAGDRHLKVEAARGGSDRAQVEHAQDQDEVADAVVHYQQFTDIDSLFWRFLLKMQRHRLRGSRFLNRPCPSPASPFLPGSTTRKKKAQKKL